MIALGSDQAGYEFETGGDAVTWRNADFPTKITEVIVPTL